MVNFVGTHSHYKLRTNSTPADLIPDQSGMGRFPINKFLTELSQNKPSKLLVISIGNPSPNYDKTRHNAGHVMLDHIAAAMGGLSESEKFWSSSVELAPLRGHPNVYLAKSLEYMNNSGRAVVAATNHLKQYRMVVVHDDVDTEQGDVKFKLESKQVGGHGGLKSIVQLYPDGFARLRIGIGEPSSRAQGDVASYVLKKFTPRERMLIENEGAPKAIDMLRQMVAAFDKVPKTKKLQD